MTPLQWKKRREEITLELSSCSDAEEFEELAQRYRSEANDLADGPTERDHWQSAIRYASLADTGSKFGWAEKDISDLHHFAGHQYRHVEAFNRAADRYEAAGEVLKDSRDATQLKWALRSYGRARKHRTELGEDDHSEQLLQQQAALQIRYLRAQREELDSATRERRSVTWNLVKQLYWKWVSGSGLRPLRTLGITIVVVAFFGLCYSWMDGVPPEAARNVISSTTYPMWVAFGYFPRTDSWLVSLIGLANFAVIWLLLGTLIAVLNRRVPGR